MKILPIALLALTLLLVVPGILLLRRPALLPQLAGTVLMLTATASAYTGVRLHLENRHASAGVTALPALATGTGRFQTIPASSLPAALAAARGHPVMLEFHADWCPSCIRWQQEVFSRTDVQQSLHTFILLQIDASELTPEVQEILDQYRLPGLPAMLFFDRTGQEQTGLRLLGEMSAEEFKTWLATRLTPLL